MINAVDPIDSWYLKRWSRFTASENFKIAVPGSATEMFTPGGKTYIEQKALEAVTRMWERPELEEAKSLLHGKMYEYPAYQEYVDVTRNFDMEHIGDANPMFFPLMEFEAEAGGTPDMISISDDQVVTHGGEIKCPKNPMFHFQRLSWKDMWDIKEGYPLVYYQIQMLMMCTGATEWDFVSFDERMIRKRDRIKIITVKPDAKYQSNFPLRLHAAVKEKYKIISKRFGENIRNRSDLNLYYKS